MNESNNDGELLDFLFKEGDKYMKELYVPNTVSKEMISNSEDFKKTGGAEVLNVSEPTSDRSGKSNNQLSRWKIQGGILNDQWAARWMDNNNIGGWSKLGPSPGWGKKDSRFEKPVSVKKNRATLKTNAENDTRNLYTRSEKSDVEDTKDQFDSLSLAE